MRFDWDRRGRGRFDEGDRGDRDLARPVERIALEDPDNPPLADEALTKTVLVDPGEGVRIPVSIRPCEEVLEYCKSLGPGYQTRINDDLLALVGQRGAADRKAASGRSSRRASA